MQRSVKGSTPLHSASFVGRLVGILLSLSKWYDCLVTGEILRGSRLRGSRFKIKGMDHDFGSVDRSMIVS